MNKSQGIVAELDDLGAVLSYHDLILRWLKKFPSTLLHRTYLQQERIETLIGEEAEGFKFRTI